MQLGETARRSGYEVEYFAELDSTNTRAMADARALDPSRYPLRKWIVAGRQSAGRGRLARPWVSEPGNLYASLLLVDAVPPVRAAELGFVTGVALAEAIAPLTPPDAAPKLKWPNDLLCREAKVAGILLEATTLPNGRFVCVVGCGINCASHPSDTPYPAASLAALGADVAPGSVFAALSDRLAFWMERWREPDGFSAVRVAWLSHASHIGQNIRVDQLGGALHGVFETIDERGRLVLVGPDGRRSIDTGDVMLPAAAKSTASSASTGH